MVNKHSFQTLLMFSVLPRAVITCTAIKVHDLPHFIVCDLIKSATLQVHILAFASKTIILNLFQNDGRHRIMQEDPFLRKCPKSVFS